MNAVVYVNVSTDYTYVEPVHGYLDEAGNKVASLTLAPGQGNFLFRQPPASDGHTTSQYWRLMPEPHRGHVYEPQNKIVDGIQAKAGIGHGKSGGNCVANTDLTDSSWTKDNGTTSITVPSDGIHLGVQMYEVTDNSNVGIVRHAAKLPGFIQNKWAHVFFFAQQVGTIPNIHLAIDGGIAPTLVLEPLRAGWPRLYHGVVQLTDAVYNQAGPFDFGLVFSSYPNTALGAYRLGGVQVVVCDSQDPAEAWCEFVATNGESLTRGNGIGAGLPVSLREITGFMPTDTTKAPEIALTNSTDVGGMPVKRVHEAHTTTDLNNKGNGAYETILTINLADWKKARKLLASFSASWQMDSAQAGNFAHWKFLLDGVQFGPIFSFPTPSQAVNYSGYGHAVTDLAAGSHTLVLQVLAGSGGLSLDIDLPELASLVAQTLELS